MVRSGTGRDIVRAIRTKKETFGMDTNDCLKQSMRYTDDAIALCLVKSPGCCKLLSGMRVLWTQYVVHETVVRVPRVVSVAAAVRSRSYRSRARIGKPVG